MPLARSDPWPAGTTGVVRLENHDLKSQAFPLSAMVMTIADSTPGDRFVRVRLLANLWGFAAEDEVTMIRASFTPD
jgi:hypothetical protein